MIRGIFFDAGNTIVFPDYDIYRGIAASLGAEVSRDSVVRAEAEARYSFDRAVAEQGGEVSDYWDVFYGSFYRALGVPEDSIARAVVMTKEADDVQLGIWKIPADGLGETIDGIRERDLATGIISNSNGRLEGRLVSIGVRDYFDFVIDSAVVGVSKPDPGIFELALKESSLAPAEAVFVGDYYEVDVVGARAVGLRPVLFDPVGAYAQPDCDVVTRLPDVLGLIDRWGES
jgi:putative hydrolase of the HAD superfamily